MYRAYHAIRGLTGPDGRSTNAVYGFVTMLRKLIADHNPQCIAAAFDLSRTDVPIGAARRLQGQPRADAVRPRRTDRVRASGVRSARRAGADLRRFRGRRRDRHAGHARRGRRPAGRDRDGRQGFLSAGRRRHGRPRVQPARRRRVVRRRRGQDEIRRRPRAGGRRPRADGRLHRQHQRRSRHRREGRARADFDARLARRAAGECADRSAARSASC